MTQQLTYKQLLRYCRHVLLPEIGEAGQEKIINSHVIVIGVGGLGSAVLPYLVASGVGQLTVFDGDKVSISNLQRQILHREDSVNSNKALSAEPCLRALNSQSDLNLISSHFNDEHADLLKQADVVVDCSDNLETRNRVNRLCWQYKIPLVSGAAIRMEGQLICFMMEDSQPCYSCLSDQFSEQQLSCVESGILAPVVGTIGTMQATETLKLISGAGEVCSQLLLYDAFRAEFRKINLSKNPQCPVCSQYR